MEQKDFEIYETDEAHDVINYIPSALQKWGMTVIGVFVAVMIAGSFMFRYPETLDGIITIPRSAGKKDVGGVLLLLPKNVGEIKCGDMVYVHIDNYPESRYGILKGVVSHINGVPTEDGYYKVGVSFPNGLVTSNNIQLSHDMQMCGLGKVVIRQRRLIETFVEPIKPTVSQ